MTRPCIIVGNGKSALNLPALPGVPLFGMNYSPIKPDYYICVDTQVLTKHWQQVYPLAWGARIAFLSALHMGSSRLYDLRNVQLVARDTRDFRAEKFMSGFTAAYVALKMAYYQGFDEVHLWGVDHSPDWRHYRADYPAPAADILARMAMMEWHYQLAAQVYARAGRVIVNHSAHSTLDRIFRRDDGDQNSDHDRRHLSVPGAGAHGTPLVERAEPGSAAAGGDRNAVE